MISQMNNVKNMLTFLQKYVIILLRKAVGNKRKLLMKDEKCCGFYSIVCGGCRYAPAFVHMLQMRVLF